MTAERSYIGDQNLPLNLPTKRRLCSTVGGRIVDGRGRTLLRRFYRALSRRHYDQLGALESGFGLTRALWRS